MNGASTVVTHRGILRFEKTRTSKPPRIVTESLARIAGTPLSQHDADSGSRGPSGPSGAGRGRPSRSEDDRHHLVTELAAAYADRSGGPDAQRQAILDALAHLENDLRPAVRRALPRPPPRRVAVAMLLSIHSHPHLASTYGGDRAGTVEVHEGSSWPLDATLLLSNELLERALAVSQWEIDDLREEIDRRAGRDLKQTRALHWMWSHFGLDGEASPWGLFRVLFPGIGSRVGEVELVSRGAQLYALIGEGTHASAPGAGPPLPALYLPWLRRDPERDLFPLTTFRSRSVDKGLRRALARSIGADDHEVDHLLESMVCLIPAENAAAFLTYDLWRSRGPATLTGLGTPYTDAVWLTELPRDGEIVWTRWLTREEGALRVADDARILFDTLAAPRVQAMMRQIYAAMLAGIHPARTDGPRLGAGDLDLFDVAQHLEAVLGPLLAWPRDPDVHQAVASALDLPLEGVAGQMLELGDAWEQQATSTWMALPGPGRPHTVHGLIVQHLVSLHSSLRRLAWDTPDPRWDHRPVLLLFAAHYLREARLERLWLKGLSDSVIAPEDPVPPAEDVVGTWFWGCWMRLLDALEGEAQSTFSSLSLG